MAARADADYILKTFPIVERNDIVVSGAYGTGDTMRHVGDLMPPAIDT